MKRGVLLIGALAAVLSLSAAQEVLKGAAAWTPKVSVKGGTSGFYAIDVKK